MEIMAMTKTGYSDAKIGTTAVKVPIDSNGYIAPAGVESAGTKRMQINRVAAENDLTDNTEVLNFFLTLAQGQQDSLTNTMSVKWEV